jgi:hypothetical protein
MLADEARAVRFELEREAVELESARRRLEREMHRVTERQRQVLVALSVLDSGAMHGQSPRDIRHEVRESLAAASVGSVDGSAREIVLSAIDAIGKPVAAPEIILLVRRLAPKLEPELIYSTLSRLAARDEIKTAGPRGQRLYGRPAWEWPEFKPELRIARGKE